MPALVPGSLINDLVRNKQIPNPLTNYSEERFKNLNTSSWVYRTLFDVSDTILNHHHINLKLSNIDTYADIYLNDSLIVQSNNMFRVWAADCKRILRPKLNKLEIRFRKVPKLNADTLCFLPGANTTVRRTAYTNGCWGLPYIPDMGIGQYPILEAWSDAKIENIYLQPINISNQLAEYTVHYNLKSDIEQLVSIEFQLDQKITWKAKELMLHEGVNKGSFTIDIKKPKLWWTNGVGKPHMYDVLFRIKRGNSIIQDLNTQLGVKDLKLVHQQNNNFYVVLNGEPLFLKGAAMVPPEMFAGSISDSRLEEIVLTAKESNMNVLRIPGRGVYYSDKFYDLCDQNGILVWHDFMFNDCIALSDTSWWNNFKQEVIENIIRLRNHCSIAFWCGNTELYLTNSYNNKHKNAINLLFNKQLPELVSQQSPHIPYWTFTLKPSAQEQAFQTGMLIGRIVDLFGSQSYSSNTKSFTTVKNKSGYWEQAFGESTSEYMNSSLPAARDTQATIYLSQIAQAEILKKAIETQRSLIPAIMGTVYWHLNSLYDHASWASIEYSGAWKPSQYAVKRAFSHILVNPMVENNKVHIYVSSDAPRGLDAILLMKLIDFSGQSLYVKQIPIDINANTASLVLSLPLNEVLKGNSPYNCCLIVQLNHPGTTLSENILYFATPKQLLLSKPKLDVRINSSVNGFNIILRTNSLVKNLVLSTKSGRCKFSENNIDLLPGVRTRIPVEYPGTREELLSDLQYRSINDLR